MTVKLLKGLISKEAQEAKSDHHAKATEIKAVAQGQQQTLNQATSQRAATTISANDAVVTNLRLNKSSDPAPKIRNYDDANELASKVSEEIRGQAELAYSVHEFDHSTGRDLLS